MKAVYNISTNEITENPTDRDHLVVYFNGLGEDYKARVIPCHEFCVDLWLDGQVVEEGVDYEILGKFKKGNYVNRCSVCNALQASVDAFWFKCKKHSIMANAISTKLSDTDERELNDMWYELSRTIIRERGNGLPFRDLTYLLNSKYKLQSK